MNGLGCSRLDETKSRREEGRSVDRWSEPSLDRKTRSRFEMRFGRAGGLSALHQGQGIECHTLKEVQGGELVRLFDFGPPLCVILSGTCLVQVQVESIRVQTDRNFCQNGFGLLVYIVLQARQLILDGVCSDWGLESCVGERKLDVGE